MRWRRAAALQQQGNLRSQHWRVRLLQLEHTRLLGWIELHALRCFVRRCNMHRCVPRKLHWHSAMRRPRQVLRRRLHLLRRRPLRPSMRHCRPFRVLYRLPARILWIIVHAVPGWRIESLRRPRCVPRGLLWHWQLLLQRGVPRSELPRAVCRAARRAMQRQRRLQQSRRFLRVQSGLCRPRLFYPLRRLH